MEGLPLAGSQRQGCGGGGSTILNFPTQMLLLARGLLQPGNCCLPGQKFCSFKALSVSTSPYSAFNAEDIGLEKILEVIFHLPEAQSHEVHLLPFARHLGKPCPREVFVCAMPQGGCDLHTFRGKHSFATWGSTCFGLCTLLSCTYALDNLSPLPAHPVYTHTLL